MFDMHPVAQHSDHSLALISIVKPQKKDLF